MQKFLVSVSGWRVSRYDSHWAQMWEQPQELLEIMKASTPELISDDSKIETCISYV